MFQETEAVGVYKWDIFLNESRRCLKSDFPFSKSSVIVDMIKKKNPLSSFWKVCKQLLKRGMSIWQE